MHRSLEIAAVAAFGAMAFLRTAGAEAPLPAPLAVVGVLDQSPQSWPYIVDGGSFVFSQYGASGNAYDVVALNLQTQALTTLAREIRSARFLARDDRRVVIADPRPPATRVRVFDASSGSILASINLGDGASWARIDGEKLLLIQRYESSHNRSTQAAVFDLPTLKLLKSVEVGWVFTAAAWGDQIVTVGKDIRIYDADWNLTGTIELPTVPPTPTSSCTPSQLVVSDDRAITTVGCNHIAVIGLKTRDAERVIDLQTGPHVVAVSEGLIYAIPGSAQVPTSRGRIFDLATGQLLATLPLKGNWLLADGNRLLGIASSNQRKDRLTLYSVDAVAIRSGKWQEARIQGECAADQDTYAAVERCEAAGIATLSRERWHEPAFAPLVRNFGVWLAAGFDRYAEAIPILEAMKPASGRDPELDLHLTDARLKVRLLDESFDGTLTAQEHQTAFGKVYSRTDERLKSQPISIDYGPFRDNFAFDADRLYFTRWSCGGEKCHSSGKPLLEIVDRETFEDIKSVAIPTDGDEDDTISSIAIHGGEIWVSTGFQSGVSTVPNLFVLDLKTFAVLRKGTLALKGQILYSRDDTLLACDCDVGGNGGCTAVDTASLAESSQTSWRCSSGAFSGADIARESNGPFHAFVKATTPNYYVVREPNSSEGHFFTVDTRGDAAAPPLLDKYTHRRFDWIRGIPGADRVLVGRRDGASLALLTYDIATGKARMLDRFTRAPREHFATAVDARFVYLSLGRDLAIYDIATGELRHYVREFISTGFDDNGYGVDHNGVAQLILDRQRLIAITSSGRASRTLDLRQLDAKPFAYSPRNPSELYEVDEASIRVGDKSAR